MFESLSVFKTCFEIRLKINSYKTIKESITDFFMFKKKKKIEALSVRLHLSCVNTKSHAVCKGLSEQRFEAALINNLIYLYN